MVIGITGGIGSGKSTIARELVRRGYTVYDCDREAKRIIAENDDVRKQIVTLLGKDAFSGDTYNTSYVAGRVFANSQLLLRLNAIIHPAVFSDIQSRLSRCDKDRSTPFFIESAILFEAGLEKLCERIIVVNAPEETRVQRVINRDYNGEATPENINKVRARVCSQQIPSAAVGLFTLVNDGKTPVAELADRVLHSLK